MLSLRATYDGKQIRFMNSEKLPAIDYPKPVIITFLEDITNVDITGDELHFMAQHGGALDFLANEEEDIYSDTDLKRKY